MLLTVVRVHCFLWPKVRTYKEMCAFAFHTIFNHPALMHKRIIMRLDTDSALQGRLPNLFRAMPPQVAYVSNPLRDGMQDCGTTSKGLRELAEDFARRMNITLRSPIGQGDGCVLGYYNNFEVIRLDAFRSSEVFAHFAAAVLADGGIKRHRWGDHILRRTALTLMTSAGDRFAQVAPLHTLAPAAGYCHKCMPLGGADAAAVCRVPQNGSWNGGCTSTVAYGTFGNYRGFCQCVASALSRRGPSWWWWLLGRSQEV